MSQQHWKRMARRSALIPATLAVTLAATMIPAQGETGPPAQQGQALMRVIVPDRAAIDRLAEQGFDLAEYAKPSDGGIEVHAVLTPEQSRQVAGMGYTVLGAIADDADVAAVLAERSATLQGTAAAEATATDTLTVLRAEWFTSIGGQRYLSVEVKTTDPAPENTLTVAWGDQSATMARFTDVGEYMYHRFNTPIPTDPAPTSATITSSRGATVTTPVTEWLGEPRKAPGPHYVSDFVDHYMDPTEVTQRIVDLQAEFPRLSEIIDLPYQTNGYRRAAQALFGSGTAAFYVTSTAYGSEGGNGITVAVLDSAAPNQPLSVETAGQAITVRLATDASGATTSTASQVAAAINASAGASSLVSAALYRGNSGAGVVAPVDATALTDGLNAPDSISRDPFQMKALRIGTSRNGSKPGVFLYCQEHAREWVTPITCVETAERLLRNYQLDAPTRKLVKDLDIFIMPTANPDGGHYSFYDANFQRKNMTNYCGPEAADPNRRTSWGVDLNRNYTVGSAFDGYQGASTTNCLSGTFAGPAELSEPEARNQVWLTEQFPNIKFAMNTHSYGGYFMWPPGAYKMPGRITLPRPDLGTEDFFWAASSHILDAVQSSRGTAIWPGQTGPVVDVLYSAAGNSADEHWYNRGIIGWDFEVGADLWDANLQRWVGVGFQPDFSEGHAEAMEFSSGQIGILEVARAYATDRTAPTSALTVVATEPGSTTFTLTADEAATIYYTLDGSRPTYASPKVSSAGMREGAETITVNSTTRVQWFSVDLAGNAEKQYRPSGKAENYRHEVVKAG